MEIFQNTQISGKELRAKLFFQLKLFIVPILSRQIEFEKILTKYRGDGSVYDCIIPVSGGKDSCYQAITMRDKYGMTPLCVTHTPCELTDVGLENLNFLRDQGFDLIQISANRKN